MNNETSNKKSSFQRSYSSPILHQTPQSLNEQLREFADKFVDTIDRNNDDFISRSPSASSSISSMSPNNDNGWIASKIGYNTIYCKHRHSCFQNCWARGVVRTFAASYITRTTWSLVSNIFQLKFNKVNINDLSMSRIKRFFRAIYFDQNSLRFALGLTILAFTYKFSLCFIFRRLIENNFGNKHNKMHYENEENFKIKYIYPALSGFIAGFLSLRLIESKSTRKTVALFCIVRAIGDLLRVLGKFNKLFIRIKHFESIMFIIFQIPLMYAFMHKPSSMNKTYFSWILRMGNLSELQMYILRVFMLYPSIKTIDYPLLSCNPVFHENSDNCFIEHIVDWFHGILRAARIYIPVHWLPTILLTPKKFLNNPWYYMKIKFINTLRSSIFLSTYQHNMKITECIGRKLINSDIIYLAMSGGITAGFAIFIEHQNRRNEMVLYVVPRAIEVILNHIPNKGIWRIFKHDLIPIIIFSISLSLWMAIRQSKGVIPIKSSASKQKTKHNKNKKNICNDLNMTALSVIFGRFH